MTGAVFDSDVELHDYKIGMGTITNFMAIDGVRWRMMHPPSRRSMGSISHLCGSIGALVSGIGLLVPLLIWGIEGSNAKQNDPFLEGHLKESANAAITFILALVAHGVLMLVLIGFVTVLIHWLLYLIWTIRATQALGNNQQYRYPMTIRIIT